MWAHAPAESAANATATASGACRDRVPEALERMALVRMMTSENRVRNAEDSFQFIDLDPETAAAESPESARIGPICGRRRNT
jgi:hypothetical protein